MLDTRSEETICKSLGNILGIRKEALEVFLGENHARLCVQALLGD